MNFVNLMKVAIKAIANNKFRSFLSMLGIIIGVAAVIVMMSIGQGSKESIRQNISQMGSNIIMIRPGADRGPGGVRQDPSAMQTLKPDDYEKIKEEAKYCTYVSPEVTSAGQIINGNNNSSTTMYGESTEYFDIKQWEISNGSAFTDEDIKKAAKVCVIGKTVADELFPGQDPVGKMVRFKSIPFRVIGVLKSKGYNSFGMDQDNLCITPYTTVMKRLTAQTWFSSINCSAITEEMTDDAIKELTAILHEQHKIKEGGEDDFTIRSQQEIMETMSSTMDTVTLILVVAAAFSLLVAGIGIMNIMLVSVTERTKEIGLRMSVGARGIDISNQFLIESIIISVTGGVLGIGLGTLLSTGANLLFGLPTSIPMWSIVVSFIVCTIIGIGFGYFPAQKAARLDPIEAIRYE
jgi:putative ABC transport system permease protein